MVWLIICKIVCAAMILSVISAIILLALGLCRAGKKGQP
jgi:hypothetical protein